MDAHGENRISASSTAGYATHAIDGSVVNRRRDARPASRRPVTRREVRDACRRRLTAQQ
jgi:hypothetical protein